MRNKDNIVYLHDNRNSVHPLDNPDWPTIRMHLEGIDELELFKSCKIPVLMEDDEARWMFKIILNNWQNIHPRFAWIVNHIHLVDVKAGADVLKGIFSDSTINTKTIGWICILDGDKQDDVSKCIITLPGKKSIEQFLYEFALRLYNEDNTYWISSECLEHGFSKEYFLDKIKRPFDDIEQKINNIEEVGESTHGMKRRLLKGFLTIGLISFVKYLNFGLIVQKMNAKLRVFMKNSGYYIKKFVIHAGSHPNIGLMITMVISKNI